MALQAGTWAGHCTHALIKWRNALGSLGHVGLSSLLTTRSGTDDDQRGTGAVSASCTSRGLDEGRGAPELQPRSLGKALGWTGIGIKATSEATSLLSVKGMHALPFGLSPSTGQQQQQQQQHRHHHHNQHRHMSLQRYIPSVDGIMATLQGPDRQVTNLLIALNIATYLATKVDRQVVYSMAGIPFNIRQGEWFRLLTSGFLHTDVLHLLANMFFINAMGPPLESAAGRTRYSLIFMAAVVGGSWLQYSYGPAMGTFWGASGGAAGLFGAYLVYRLRNRNFIVWDAGDTNWVAQMVGLNLLLGLAAGGSIAHWGHLGGLLTGAAACWLIGPRYQWRHGGVVDAPILPFFGGSRR